MFTIKYRAYNLSPKQDAAGYPCYDENEQCWGPFEFVSKELTPDLYPVVYCHYTGGGLPMSFGAIPFPDESVTALKSPRPTLWVMNEAGATIAKYDL